MLDFPAAGQALWIIFDRLGIRPEYALSSLWVESGLNPAASNAAGAPYYGINQESGTWLQDRWIDSADYLTWPASQQLLEVVLPSWGQMISATGVIPKSGTRVEQMNFLPASLKTATSLGDVLTRSPSATYSANAALDVGHKGYITVTDISHFVSHAVPAIQSVIAQTYALRPGETPQDPVFGTDFPWWDRLSPVDLAFGGAAVTAVTVAIAVAVRDGYLPHPRWFR
jgi:hypothetical protein